MLNHARAVTRSEGRNPSNETFDIDDIFNVARVSYPYQVGIEETVPHTLERTFTMPALMTKQPLDSYNCRDQTQLSLQSVPSH